MGTPSNIANFAAYSRLSGVTSRTGGERANAILAAQRFLEAANQPGIGEIMGKVEILGADNNLRFRNAGIIRNTELWRDTVKAIHENAPLIKISVSDIAGIGDPRTAFLAAVRRYLKKNRLAYRTHCISGVIYLELRQETKEVTND